MGFVYSTDSSYTEFIKKRVIHKQRENMFALFTRSATSENNSTGQLNISAAVARKANTLKTAIVGYDKDKRELIIIPSIVGNITVSKMSSGYTGDFYGSLALLRFLLSQGFERKDIPKGRFAADVDDEGNIHIYLDRPLEGVNRKFKGEENGIE